MTRRSKLFLVTLCLLLFLAFTCYLGYFFIKMEFYFGIVICIVVASMFVYNLYTLLVDAFFTNSFQKASDEDDLEDMKSVLKKYKPLCIMPGQKSFYYSYQIIVDMLEDKIEEVREDLTYITTKEENIATAYFKLLLKLDEGNIEEAKSILEEFQLSTMTTQKYDIQKNNASLLINLYEDPGLVADVDSLLKSHYPIVKRIYNSILYKQGKKEVIKQ